MIHEFWAYSAIHFYFKVFVSSGEIAKLVVFFFLFQWKIFNENTFTKLQFISQYGNEIKSADYSRQHDRKSTDSICPKKKKRKKNPTKKTSKARVSLMTTRSRNRLNQRSEWKRENCHSKLYSRLKSNASDSFSQTEFMSASLSKPGKKNKKIEIK